ncbi:hypothetical protein, partial [Pandoraea capi]|uniref:hypothetical protein n=1 Tax=Pandoraea capi TaxID=2508286 RepID=UPI001C2DAAF8
LLHVRLLLRKRTLLDSGWPCLQGAGHGYNDRDGQLDLLQFLGATATDTTLQIINVFVPGTE